jgi:periplasmic protein TonB
MRTGLILGITCAILLHAGVLLFGGSVFGGHQKSYATLAKVELVSDDSVTEKDKAKDKPKEEEPPTEKKDDMKAEDDRPPDSAEVIRNLELSAAASAPKLEAASLGAIEAALGGQALGGGDFASAVDFSSGGRIGGTAKAGTVGESLDREFDLTEIDQKPRAIFQAAPVYPASVRGSKIEGVVSVRFVVDATGKVVNPGVDKSTNPAFEKPALDAVKQWKFEPAVRAGQRVSCKMRVPIRFQPR